MSNFKFRSFGNSKQNILLCDIDECYMIKKLKQTLAEIKEIAGQLYYQAIKDPVKREAAIYKIISKVNEVENEKI